MENSMIKRRSNTLESIFTYLKIVHRLSELFNKHVVPQDKSGQQSHGGLQLLELKVLCTGKENTRQYLCFIQASEM